MNHSTAVFIANDAARALSVAYEQSEEHSRSRRTTFKTLDPSIKVNDYVVIPTTTRYEFTIGKVIEADLPVDFSSNTPMGWIAGTMDKAAYDDLIEQESKLINGMQRADTLRQRKELKATMDSMMTEDMAALTIISES